MGYGHGTRLLKCELERTATPGWTQSRKWGHNRLRLVYADRIEYRLYDATIATHWADGRITVRTGGFNTLTTKAAIDQALRLIDPVAFKWATNAWSDERTGTWGVAGITGSINSTLIIREGAAPNPYPDPVDDH